jgi:hypothetical protein
MVKTSEFWIGLATAVLGGIGTYLHTSGIISPEQWTVIQGFIISGITYVVGRLTSKAVKK